MESGDEDIFAISDEDILSSAQPTPVNPIEEHLLKELADVQSRIDAVTSEIVEIRATTARVLNALEWRALHGEDASEDSDSELYTIEGAPVIKKRKHSRTSSTEETILELISQWQCVLEDKWIIGVELYNSSYCTLLNPRYYPYVLPARDEEIFGESTFWKLKEEPFLYSEQINSIQPGAIVATMVLDLPTFDQEPVVKCWGIISYEIDETQFQVPVPPIQLSIVRTIDSSCIKFLNENEYGAILALKSTSTIEKIINIKFSRDDRNSQEDSKNGFSNKLFRFLTAQIFAKVCNNIFLMKEHGSLMYCLIEIKTIDVDQVNIKIFARSVNQLNIILHLLQDEFSNVSVAEETDDCMEAAMALIRELELIRDKKNILEVQEAKVITDLLIP